MIAYLVAVFLAGVLVGAIVGGAYVLREAERRTEERLRLVHRYGGRQ